MCRESDVRQVQALIVGPLVDLSRIRKRGSMIANFEDPELIVRISSASLRYVQCSLPLDADPEE